MNNEKSKRKQRNKINLKGQDNNYGKTTGKDTCRDKKKEDRQGRRKTGESHR
jgi:hypothetical protein